MKLFIGIDFSKKTFDVSMFEQGNTESKNYCQFNNDKDGFLQFIKWIKSHTHIKSSEWLFCGENTGLYSIALSEFLLKKGLFIWIETPLQIRRSGGIKREKNDKVDSAEIALYAFRFKDKAKCYAPKSKELAALSNLLSFRDRLIRNKNSLLVSASELKSSLEQDPTVQFIYEESMKDVERINNQIKDIGKRMKEMIDSDEDISENYQLITSIKGISIINATAIIVQTANFTSFENARQFACYAGVVPFGKSSGTSIKSPRRTSKLSNRNINSLLTQAARCAIMYDSEINQYYLRKIEEGKGKRVVVNNVKNKLVHRIFAVVNNKTPYQPDYANKINCNINC